MKRHRKILNRQKLKIISKNIIFKEKISSISYMQYQLLAKIKGLNKIFTFLQKKMIFAYKFSEYKEGNFFYKLLVEREKIIF